MTEPATAQIPSRVLRVARRRGLLTFSRITPDDAALPRAGNRFDVAGGGVLYAGTDAEACYAETLARFRPTPVIRDLVKNETDFMVAGGVPQDWRLQRTLGTIEVTAPLPFLDLEAPETHQYLSTEMYAEMLALGYDDNLDFADVCNRDRRLTRAIAAHAYTATSDDGTFIYSGIRYMSRIRPDWECWAIFEGTQLEEVHRQSIELTDPCLQKVADLWGLRIF